MAKTNEIPSLSSYSISVSVNDNIEPVSLATFTALCDRYAYEELNHLLTRYPSDTLVYPHYNNKTRATIILSKTK